MIKRTFFYCFMLATTQQIQPHELNNQLLKIADKAGFFNRGIIDILKVRQKIKEFISGKLNWKGVEFQLTIVDDQNNPMNEKLKVIMRKPETLFGATFIIINPNHPAISSFQTPTSKAQIDSYISQVQKQSLLSRYEKPTTHGVATNLFAINPMTKERIPVFVADYILEEYDARVTHAHIAVPAHNQKDFNFAKHHNLPIKLVINSAEQGKPSSPQYVKGTQELKEAYQGEYDDCIIVNSDFLNGSAHHAHQEAIKYLETTAQAVEYKKPFVYQLSSKHYSLHELQLIEMTLAKEHKDLSAAQKELLLIIMIQTQADFLTIVEQFLINAKENKELMVQIIEESCTLRETKDGYLYKWAHSNMNESEKVLFKRDINTFKAFCKFGAELVDFLGDFASSCPHALETIKHLKHS